MSKKTLILSQKQLDEIVGGNATYLDNTGEDFAKNGNNEVYASGKLDRCDGKPIPTDRLSHQLVNNNGFLGYGSHGKDFSRAPIYFYESTKKDWAKKNLSEEYNDPTMTNAKFSTGNNTENGTPEQRNLGSIKTQKMRFGAAQAKANSTDPTIKKQGEETMKTMLKNDPNLGNEINQYNNLQKTAAMGRETDKKLFGTPIKDRNKNAANTQSLIGGKDDSGIITYDEQ